MPEESELLTAINDRDAASVRKHVRQSEFILVDVSDEESEDDSDVGALTASIDDFDVLVVFTSEEAAGQFVEAMPEMFEDQDDITGHVVEGEALLEYLPDNFGLLVNPESDEAQVVDPVFVKEVLAAAE